jgi:hypothetical protein
VFADADFELEQFYLDIYVEICFKPIIKILEGKRHALRTNLAIEENKG